MTTPNEKFSASWLASQPLEVREKLIASLSPEAARALLQDYDFLARPTQREPPGSWFVWLLLGGRGAGKTWVGSNMVKRWATSGVVQSILLAGATPEDVRDVMIEGPSGILTLADPQFRPKYEPSKKRLSWPNGCRAHIRSGAEPERFRGLNSEKAWLDELASWQYPAAAWANAVLGLRLGTPQIVVTTTPKPIKLLSDLVKNPRCVTTRDSSYANRANLSDDFYANVVRPLEGTRVSRQEIYAEILTDLENALWRQDLIDHLRYSLNDRRLTDEVLGRTVIAVDPAVTSGANSNETGILAITAGRGVLKGHAFVLRDLSGRHPASEWPKIVAAAYRTLFADRVVAEVNQGGDLVESALRVVDPNISYQGVRASKGKRTRAEPVSQLYERGLVHHVGTFGMLESQMITFLDTDQDDDKASPDRVDALVWGLTALLLGPKVFLA